MTRWANPESPWFRLAMWSAINEVGIMRVVKAMNLMEQRRQRSIHVNS